MLPILAKRSGRSTKIMSLKLVELQSTKPPNTLTIKPQPKDIISAPQSFFQPKKELPEAYHWLNTIEGHGSYVTCVAVLPTWQHRERLMRQYAEGVGQNQWQMHPNI